MPLHFSDKRHCGEASKLKSWIKMADNLNKDDFASNQINQLEALYQRASALRISIEEKETEKERVEEMFKPVFKFVDEEILNVPVKGKVYPWSLKKEFKKSPETILEDFMEFSDQR